MHLKLHHGRRSRQGILRQQVFSDNHHLRAGRTYVLLYARIHQSVLCHVHGLRQKAGRYVGNQNLPLGVWQGMIFRTVNRIILTDIDIIHIIRYGKIGAVRNIGEGLICRRGKLHRLPVNLCLGKCLLGPLSGQNITCLAVLHQIHGHGCKQKACTALQKQYFIVIRNLQERAQIRLRLLNDRVINLRPMAHLHDRHSRPLIIEHLLRSLFQHLFRQNCGAR